MKAHLEKDIIEFDSIIIKVPRDGEKWDWLCEEWESIEIIPKVINDKDRVIVMWDESKSYNINNGKIQPLPKEVNDEEKLKAHIHEQKVIELEKSEYEWGELYVVDWSNYGYAPGGLEYFLKPKSRMYFYTTGSMELNWKTVKIYRSA